MVGYGDSFNVKYLSEHSFPRWQQYYAGILNLSNVEPGWQMWGIRRLLLRDGVQPWYQFDPQLLNMPGGEEPSRQASTATNSTKPSH